CETHLRLVAQGLKERTRRPRQRQVRRHPRTPRSRRRRTLPRVRDRRLPRPGRLSCTVATWATLATPGDATHEGPSQKQTTICIEYGPLDVEDPRRRGRDLLIRERPGFPELSEARDLVHQGSGRGLRRGWR